MVAVSLVAAMVGFSSTIAGAQEADADQVCVTQEINAHFIIGGESSSAVFPIDIPAGVVSIPEARSRDFYEGRSAISQPSEKWQLEFLDAAGNVIAVSAPTEDVPDGEEDQSWTGALPDVGLPVGAAGIRAIHRPDLPADGQAMSVWANGITLCWPAAVEVCEADSFGNPVAPNDEGVCPGPCGSDADGTPIAPGPDGACPETTGEIPTLTPPCTDADGNSVSPDADGQCPAPPPQGPVDCGNDATGGAISPDADGNCPTPTEGQAPPPPLQPAPTPQPTLPVTGIETTLLISLAGIFLMAAGWSLVLRPGEPQVSTENSGASSPRS